MSNYSVWMLEESNITISAGQTLDGITQGDGSHLKGETIRLDSNAWIETFVRDAGGDADFDDNDGNQRLDGDQTISGNAYSDGTKVEAEYSLTLQDPNTGTEYQVLGYNLNDSSPAYGTIEGLAFVGPPGGFPPTGVDLDVVSASEGPGSMGQPDIAAGNLATPPCFTPGTRILTPAGPVPVEILSAGDLVETRDRGAQPVRWAGRVTIGRARLGAEPALDPVRIRAGAFGAGRPARDMLLSPQHRILLDDWRAELWFGLPEVLVAARHLVNDRDILVARNLDLICYIHLLFDHHEVIWSDGLPSESFRPGPQTMPAIPAESRRELQALFPGLSLATGAALRTARPVLRAWEARLMAPPASALHADRRTCATLTVC